MRLNQNQVRKKIEACIFFSKDLGRDGLRKSLIASTEKEMFVQNVLFINTRKTLFIYALIKTSLLSITITNIYIYRYLLKYESRIF